MWVDRDNVCVKEGGGAGGQNMTSGGLGAGGRDLSQVIDYFGGERGCPSVCLSKTPSAIDDMNSHP